MMGMTGTKSGRKRRKAWIHGVISPLVEELRVEATLCRKVGTAASAPIPSAPTTPNTSCGSLGKSSA